MTTAEPATAEPGAWMYPLAEVWALVPESLRPALEPLRALAICWGRGALPSWPPDGWLLEDRVHVELLNTLLRPEQPHLIVLHRGDCQAALGASASTYPSLAVAGAMTGWALGVAQTQAAVHASQQATERVGFGAQIGMMLTAQTVGLYHKLPQLCSAEELAIAYHEGHRVTAAVLKALDRTGVPTPEDFGPPVAPLVQPPLQTALQAATAPLHLSVDHAADPAPVPEQRPFGFHSAAQARRDADRAWDLYWGQAPRYL